MARPNSKGGSFWYQLRAVATLQTMTVVRQKVMLTSLLMQVLLSIFLPLLYIFVFSNEFKSIYELNNVDEYPHISYARHIMATVAVAYDSSTEYIGYQFADDYYANYVVSNSSSYMSLVEQVEDGQSSIGVAFESLDSSTFVVSDVQGNLLAAVQALYNDTQEIILYSLPLVYLEQSKSSYLYTAILTIFMQYAVITGIYLLVPYGDSRVEKRTSVLVFNGGSIYKWDFLWLLLSSVISIVILALSVVVMAIFGAPLARVNPLIWIPEIVLSAIMYVEYGMVFLFLAKTKEQVQTVLGLLTMLVFVSAALLIGVGAFMPNWAFIPLSILPSFPFNYVVNMMAFSAYSSDKLSLGYLYDHWQLHWCLLVYVGVCGLMYFLLCRLDHPLVNSTCQVGVDYPAQYETVTGFYNKNVREECQSANQYLLQQDRASDVMFYNVTKHFGETKANNGISLLIPHGKVTGILGPNGSGKTTLLNALFKAHKLDAGDVFINGVSVKKGINYIGVCMQDNVSLFEWLTVYENIYLYRAFARNPNDIQLLGLDYKQLANTLSGGMKRRLSLACALVNRPSILVLDEPTAGVDPNGRKELWELIRTLAPTIISTTHMLDEASSYFDRVAFIMQGKLVCVGNVGELYGSGISCNVYGRINDERYSRVGSAESRVGCYRTYLTYSEVFDDMLARKQAGEIEYFEINAYSFDWIYLELSQHVWRSQ